MDRTVVLLVIAAQTRIVGLYSLIDFENMSRILYIIQISLFAEVDYQEEL